MIGSQLVSAFEYPRDEVGEAVADGCRFSGAVTAEVWVGE
jgi:hypothetical protein